LLSRLFVRFLVGKIERGFPDISGKQSIRASLYRFASLEEKTGKRMNGD
jgi:hypothetical protein